MRIRVLLFILGTSILTVRGQQGNRTGDWQLRGGDGGNTRYSALDQINKDNVKSLKVAWTWKSDNYATLEYKSETTPILANGTLYFTAGTRRNVIAADPATGETLWTWRLDEGERF